MNENGRSMGEYQCDLDCNLIPMNAQTPAPTPTAIPTPTPIPPPVRDYVRLRNHYLNDTLVVNAKQSLASMAILLWPRNTDLLGSDQQAPAVTWTANGNYVNLNIQYNNPTEGYQNINDTWKLPLTGNGLYQDYNFSIIKSQ